MHAYLRRALCAVGLTGGIVLLGVGLAEAASADGPSGPVTSGAGGIVSGNQTGADVQAPIDLSGNQVTVIGQDNKTTSTGGSATASSAPSGSPTTSGEDGIGSGNQTRVVALVPVNASGNQVTVIGQDNKTTSTGDSTAASSAPSGSPTTSGEDGIGSGNQTGVVALVPVNASGNQITVIGQDNTDEAQGGSAAATPAATSGGAPPTTSGEHGILSGNQTGVAALVPVNASGNQLTVIGQHNTVGSTGSSATSSPGHQSSGPVTSGENGIGSGNQTAIGLAVPVDVTGNQGTVIGQDNTLESTGTSTTGTGSTGPGETTTGEGGAGSGNQTPVGATAPVDSSGNQVTVVGQGNTDTSTSGSTSGGTTPGGGTTTPPTGTVVSPPTAGTGAGTATGATGVQAVAAPVDSALPNTGAPADLVGVGLFGLLLMLLGGAILRREEAVQ